MTFFESLLILMLVAIVLLQIARRFSVLASSASCRTLRMSKALSPYVADE